MRSGITQGEALAVALTFVGGAVFGPLIIHAAVFVGAVYAALLGGI